VHPLPFFADGKNADADILYLPRKRKWEQVFRLAKFFSKYDFIHWNMMVKNRKEKFALVLNLNRVND